MELKIHPDAINNFNDKFELLLHTLKKANSITSDPIHIFKTDEITHKLKSQKIIIQPLKSSVDPIKGEVSNFFSVDGETIGFFGEDYTNFIKLCEKLHHNHDINRFVSLDSLNNIIFEWIYYRYRSKTSSKMWDYIKPILEKDILERQIWIPLFMIQIESEFTIGKVKFRQMDKTLFDEWFSIGTINMSEEEKKVSEQYYEKIRNKYQGYAAALITITAEHDKAIDIAFDEVDKTVDLLRIYDSAIAHPLLNSNLTLYGKSYLPKRVYFDRQNSIFDGEELLNRNIQNFRIDNTRLDEMRKNGLNILSDLLLNDDIPFNKNLITALQIYSNSLLSLNITDKIISMLVSLESLLLKGDEPIQQNVGDRMAFAITRDGNLRKEIVNNLKHIYKLRSRYIHHANEIPINSLQEIVKFMKNIWLFYMILIKNSVTIHTKEDLIDLFDNMKYHGTI